MANFGAKILGNAVSAINAQQALIANAANNIANVNTEGYSKRSIELITRGGQSSDAGVAIGNGVELGAVTRANDAFLEGLVQKLIFPVLPVHVSINNLPTNTAVKTDEITPMINTIANPLIGPNPK